MIRESEFRSGGERKKENQVATEHGKCVREESMYDSHYPTIPIPYQDIMFVGRSLLPILVAVALFSAPVSVHSFHFFDNRRPRMRNPALPFQFDVVDSPKYFTKTCSPKHSYQHLSSALKYKNHREVQVDLDLQFSLDDVDMTMKTGGPFWILLEFVETILASSQCQILAIEKGYTCRNTEIHHLRLGMRKWEILCR
eukprot:scaffold36484_cov229-Amphora_coffeaeformis.AAC.5